MTPRPAVFLDRDGTLIEERHYPTSPADIVLVPDAARCLSRLAAAGYRRIVLTNQSVVARGMITEAGLEHLHAHMIRKLARDGADLDALYYCPHHPDGSSVAYRLVCGCRKPAEGLLRMAVAQHDVDLARSCFIGDSPRDLFPTAGPVAARILLGEAPSGPDAIADHVAPGLAAAVDWLLRVPTPETDAAQGT